MSTTLSTQTFRNKFRSTSLDVLLRKALVAEKICQVDRTELKTLQNPYSSTPTVTIQALNGTYSVATVTTTDSTLTVADEFIAAEQVFDYEQTLSNFDIYANRIDEQNYGVAWNIDKFVLNSLANGAGGSYTTPTGGFTTAANVSTIVANILAKVSGYVDAYKGIYCVVENTDLTGIIPFQATNGYSYADAALNNGFLTNIMGVDFYVIRDGTFVTATIGTLSATNSGCRLAGVKDVTTYAAPRGITTEELMVTGKTGKEIRTYGYIGAKVWASKNLLTIKITLA